MTSSTSIAKNQVLRRLVGGANVVVGTIGVALTALLLVGARQGWFHLPGLGAAGEPENQARDSRVETPSEVHLTAEKLVAARLHVARAQTRSLQDSCQVPGKISYDANRHLEMTAPVDCVVARVFVEPGQKVAAGAPLAVLSSPEVGLARDELLKKEADLAIAERELVWCGEIADNVEGLLKRLAAKPTLQEAEENVGAKKLGDYRDKILSSYSKLILAELLAAGAEAIKNTGALSERLMEERRSAREVAAAQFRGSCETSRFESSRERDKAKAAAEQAQRLLKVSHEKLAGLLGPYGDTTALPGRDRLSEFTVRSPLEGKVETRHVVIAARVLAGKPIFTIANTSQLWVEAEIHERNWRVLDTAAAGGEVKIRVPALGNREFPAQIRFIGSEVSNETRSVPLVANLDNREGKFKPGMIIWVDVPLGAPRKALCVPAGAIMRHEEQAFVFAPQIQERFLRVPVTPGLERGEWVEIVAGLEEGAEVVDQGAFTLKSELLLERE